MVQFTNKGFSRLEIVECEPFQMDNLKGQSSLVSQDVFLKTIDNLFVNRTINIDKPITILYLNIDEDKIAFNTIGNNKWRLLLKKISIRLNRCLLKTNNIISRLETGSFGVFLAENSQTTEKIAKKILSELRRSFYLDGKEVFITASIGIANSNLKVSRANDLLRNSRIAMLKAKKAGKDCVFVLDKKTIKKVTDKFLLINDLKRALDNDEFVLHYQPILNIEKNEIVSFEALIRWNHPEKGMIFPNYFIPIAEETGLIYRIEDWVIEKAAAQLKQWHNLSSFYENLSMSVNVSPTRFRNINYVEEIKKVLSKNILLPKHLTLEITERVMVDKSIEAINTLEELSKFGVSIALDDFGTGYSSLLYLQQLPISIIKIDRSFVSLIGNNQKNSQILQSILTLSNALNLKIVAEGIENTHQKNFLTSLDCSLGQGFLYSRPVRGKKISSILKQQLKKQNMISKSQNKNKKVNLAA